MLIELSDSGEGIAEDQIDLIFDPLFSTKQGRGTGLGLTVVKQIVSEHNGQVEVESEPGLRTTFRIRLPLHDKCRGRGNRASSLCNQGPGIDEMRRILVIDDDLETCNFLAEIFSEEGWSVSSSQTAEAARVAVEREPFDLIVSDINLGGRTNGVALLKEFKAITPDSEVILISGFGTLETAVEAVREGAFDYISKPFNVNAVIATARRALKGRDTSEPAAVLLKESTEASGLIGHSAPMIELYKEIALVAPSRSTVLITGESGTGKELVARAMHRNSPRSVSSFVAVNCGAITETLLESELFGHVKGSFTGAVSDKRGLFEEAHGGTIFLDEIGETSLALQVKLLRVLQESEIRRVGSARAARVDVRVLAATNRDLEREVKEGRFREDLFYRLSVVTLRVPPLRERAEDLRLLAAHALKHARDAGARATTISEEVLALVGAIRLAGQRARA